MIALGVFFQDVIEECLTVVKIHALQQSERAGQVEETALRRTREKTQRWSRILFSALPLRLCVRQ